MSVSKGNSILIYTFLGFYLLSSNWTLADFLVPPVVKNIIVGLLLLIFSVTVFLDKTRPNNGAMALFGFSVLIPSLINGTTNISIYVQSLFIIFIGIFGGLKRNELFKFLQILNVVFVVFLTLHSIQWLLLFQNEQYLVYAYPVTHTNLGLFEKAEVVHWIQFMGGLTRERFDVLGSTMPRFAGFLTEPSAAANLILLPRVILIQMRGKVILSDFLFFLWCSLIWKSGFIVIYLSLLLILLAAEHYNLLNSLTVLFGLIFFVVLVIGLEKYAAEFLEITSQATIYGLENKSNTVTVRVLGFYDIINNLSFFGNANVETAGVGAAFLYLARYGFAFIIPLFLLCNKLLRNGEYIALLLLVFALVLLGKGFSSFAILIILFNYAESFIGNQHAR